jgi:hypothetical protein
LILSRRKKVSAKALSLHRERRYLCSTPLFISQAEGILTDYLVACGDIPQDRKGKVFAKVKGKKRRERRLNRKVNPIQLTGIASRLAEAEFIKHLDFSYF